MCTVHILYPAAPFQAKGNAMRCLLVFINH